SATPIALGPEIFRVELSHNTPERIRQELLDTNTVRLLAKLGGLTEADLSKVQIAPWPDARGTEVALYQLGKSEQPYSLLAAQLDRYLHARLEGHTKEFLMAAITNRLQPSSISDIDLRALVASQPLVPP